MVSAPGSRTTVGIASPPDQAHLDAATSAWARRARVLISQTRRTVSSSADAAIRSRRCKTATEDEEMEVGEIAPTKGMAQRARSSPERIHYTNQSVTPAALPLRGERGPPI